MKTWLPRLIAQWYHISYRTLVEIREFLDDSGRSPFGRWFNRLNPTAAAKVVIALTSMEQGNFSNVTGVGQGVREFRIDFGPGYRIYFGQDGDNLIILLGGGTKRRQQRDIQQARAFWRQYRQG